jgi:hypothetical protein
MAFISIRSEILSARVTIMVTALLIFAQGFPVFANVPAKSCFEILQTTVDRSDNMAAHYFEVQSMWMRREQEDIRVGVKRFTKEEQLENEIKIHNGLLYYKGELFDTSNGSADGRADIQIIALTLDGRLITIPHAPVDIIHHSTLSMGLSGLFFGEIRATKGKIRMISNMSGHYKPPIHALQNFVNYLRLLGVEIDDSKVVEINDDPDEEED